jgi:hypothetical protein
MRTAMEQILNAREKGCPFIIVKTGNQLFLRSKMLDLLTDEPVFQLSIASGLKPLNELSQEKMRDFSEAEGATDLGMIIDLIGRDLDKGVQQIQRGALDKDDEPIVAFPVSYVIIGADRAIGNNNTLIQFIVEQRDLLKGCRASIVLFTTDKMNLPSDLNDDCIYIEELLPNDSERMKIIVDLIAPIEGFPFSHEDKFQAVQYTKGMNSFEVEQKIALCLTSEGIDIEELQRLWAETNGSIAGLAIEKAGVTEDDIKGLKNFIGYMKLYFAGKKPSAIVFMDEIEKDFSTDNRDSSGTTDAIKGQFLSFTTDNDCDGVLLAGSSGSGKSYVSKFLGTLGKIPLFRLSISGLKGSLVGESEKNCKKMFDYLKAVCGTNILFVGTTNDETKLQPEIRARFSMGTWFFDMLAADERKDIWEVYVRKFGLSGELPDDGNYNARNIYNCCKRARDFKISPKEAGKYEVPFGLTGREQIDRLSSQADGKYLSANYEGFYLKNKTVINNAVGKRAMKL